MTCVKKGKLMFRTKKELDPTKREHMNMSCLCLEEKQSQSLSDLFAAKHWPARPGGGNVAWYGPG